MQRRHDQDSLRPATKGETIKGWVYTTGFFVGILAVIRWLSGA